MKPSELASMIDHTALKPETSASQIEQLCSEAREYGFVAVCIPPYWVSLADRLLSGTPTKIATVIGFPHGNTIPDVKCYEAERAIASGAHELDMVINIGALKSGDEQAVLHDIIAVVQVALKSSSVIVKVIIETALLTKDEKVKACRLTEAGGAHFVKTSTGFGPAGATREDIILLRSLVGQRMGVKAAGGIRDLATAQSMIQAGASRIGCSASVHILNDALATTPRERNP
jgi:deoxyribose-phosphate aldolase